MTGVRDQLGLFQRESGRGPRRRRVLAVLGPLVALAAFVLVGGLIQYLAEGRASFLAWGSQALVLKQSATVVTAAVGMTLIIIAGGIDLSVGSSVALTAVMCAWVIQALAPGGAARLAGAEAVYAPLAALVAAVAVGAAVGAANGAMVTGLRLPPFIATLGMMAFARGTAQWLADNQKIDAPITFIADLMRPVVGPEQLQLRPAGLVAIALLVGGGFLLAYTRLGRHVFAIGSSEATARLCGVRVERTKLLVYTAAGALFGVAGIMNFADNNVGDPTTAPGMELEVIAAVVIGGGSLSGGRGTMVGTLVGAALMAELRVFTTLLGLPNYVQLLVLGLVIVAAVALDQWRRRRSA